MSASHTRVALAPAGGVFARVYVHAGMVSYHGEKMSKSLGNLVFVNKLLADGVDPMAIRMALLAHHYRSDWEWTDAVLGDAQARLARWRAALARAEGAIPEGAIPAALPRPRRHPRHPGRNGAGGRASPDARRPRRPRCARRRRPLGRCPARRTSDPHHPGDLAGARLVQATADALLGVRL